MLRSIHFLLLFSLLISCEAKTVAQNKIGSPRLMQGPVVGSVGPEEITIWARLSGNFPFRVEYADNQAMDGSKVSKSVVATKEKDYCVRVRLEDLQPNTTYFYRVQSNDGPDKYLGKRQPFLTKTAPSTPGKFRVALGSCLRFGEDPIQPIWNVVDDLNPDLFFWLGDNIYGDALDADILAEEYRRQRNLPHLRRVMARIPQLAIWDDHDYGLNNHDRTNPIKRDALRVFKQYWPNPAFGLPKTPGVFFKYSYGGVDFFFIDCRYHRDPNKDSDANKSMLGKIQFAWLCNSLKASKAPFKVILSGSGWTKSKGETGDAWSAFLSERNRLFDFIRDQSISGVVLASGDTHIGELNCVPWSEKGGYDLYELVSSPLAQSTDAYNLFRQPEVRIRRPVVSACNVGVMDFDLTCETPKIQFTAFNHYGDAVWTPVEISKQDLVNGQSTWKEKQDNDVLEYQKLMKN